MFKKTNKPWYKYYKEYLIASISFMEAFMERYSLLKLSGDYKKLERYFIDLEKEYFTRFIFESNNIESEGLPKGETKKLVLELFEKSELNKNLEGLTDILFNVKFDINVYEKIQSDLDDFSKLDNYQLLLKHGRKKKDLLLVLNGLNALIESRSYVKEYASNATSNLISKIFVDGGSEKAMEVFSRNKNLNSLNEEERKEFDQELEELVKYVDMETYKKTSNHFGFRPMRLFRYLKNEDEDGNYLLSEEKIKKLHELISSGMDSNGNVPGVYRTESACIDINTPFLPPTAIEGAMDKLIKDHEKRYKKNYYNPFTEACKLSGDFVLIHPFADFNGRVSRILLNMVLQSEYIPFYLILRSNARDKNKYITAMKHYYNGNPNSYLALICKVFLEEISSINSKLKISGLEPIIPKKLNAKQMKLIDCALEDYNKNAYKFS